MSCCRYKPGTYVKGIELRGKGNLPRELRGWIDNDFTGKDGCCISVDTSDRETAWLQPSSVHEVNRVPDWETAIHRELPLNTPLRHFKGSIYTIIAIADHVDLGKCVVYKDSSEHVWVREYAEFMSKVDTNKYPNAKQEYRFELDMK